MPRKLETLEILPKKVSRFLAVAAVELFHQKGELKKAIEEFKAYLNAAPHAPDATLVRRKIRGLQLMDQGSAPPLTAPL